MGISVGTWILRKLKKISLQFLRLVPAPPRTTTTTITTTTMEEHRRRPHRRAQAQEQPTPTIITTTTTITTDRYPFRCWQCTPRLSCYLDSWAMVVAQ